MSSASAFDPVPVLVAELTLPRAGVAAVVKLLAEGATVPFIARYRKEATGGLDEVQIRAIEERSQYLIELEARRASVLARDREAGQAHAGARARKIARRDAPRPSSRTSTCRSSPSAARAPRSRTERGLEPLAERSGRRRATAAPHEAAQPSSTPAKDVPDVAAALAGARDICAERIAEDAERPQAICARRTCKTASIRVSKTQGARRQADQVRHVRGLRGAGREDAVASLPRDPPRRDRGRAARRRSTSTLEPHLPLRRAAASRSQAASPWAARARAGRRATRSSACSSPAVEIDVRVELKLRSDRDAIDVFAQNLRELLLAAPLRRQDRARHRSGPAHRLQVRASSTRPASSSSTRRSTWCRATRRSRRRARRCARSARSTRSARDRGRQRHPRPRDRGVRARRARAPRA